MRLQAICSCLAVSHGCGDAIGACLSYSMGGNQNTNGSKIKC